MNVTDCSKDQVIVDKLDNAQNDTKKFFQCSCCFLKEKYECYSTKLFLKNYIPLEHVYVISDPFLPVKEREYIVLAADCVECKLAVCKDIECSVYFKGTYCRKCATLNILNFPNTIQDKIRKHMFK